MGFRGKVYVPDASSAPSFPVHGSALADSIFTRIVTYYATEFERDTETAVPGKMSAAEKLGMRCYVANGPRGFGDWCGWTGSEWIWAHPAPIYSVSSGLGASPAFNNTSPAAFTTAAYAYTPSRSGELSIGYDTEVAGVTAGWGLAVAAVRLNGVLISDSTMYLAYENASGTRVPIRFDSRSPVWATKNVAMNLGLDVYCASAAGSWRLNSFGWKLTLR